MSSAARIPEAPKVEKLLYSKNDAAYALSISVRSIDRMIAGRVLPTRRLGSRIVIPAAAIKSLADQILRQDMLGPIGAPVTKRELRLIHKQNERQTKDQPEGARRLRASAQ